MAINYEEHIKTLLSIMNEWTSGKIKTEDIPFEKILVMVQEMYEEKNSNGEKMALLYGRMLTSALEVGNVSIVSDVFSMLAEHMMIFISDRAKVNAYEMQKRRLMEQVNERKLTAYQLQVKLNYKDNCRRNELYYERHPKREYVPFEGKGVVYSAITGGYDTIKEPKFINPDWDYILFTDNPEIKSDIWQIRLIENEENLDATRLARKVKIMGHKYLQDYDYSIWIDGKLEIYGNLEKYIRENRKSEPLLCFGHYLHDCIYQELDLCTKLKKDDETLMNKQIEKYKKEGYPEHNGLVETGLLVREIHNADVKKVMEIWWDEVKNYSTRDQLSFNYALWKNDTIYDSSEIFIYSNEYVELYKHC